MYGKQESNPGKNAKPAPATATPIATSPVIKKAKDEGKEFTFGEALLKVADGQKIRKLEWGDVQDYGFMQDTFLLIYRNGESHVWKISEGDIIGKDWIIV